MSNFASILDRPSTEIERPKPLPAGTYTCVVNGLPRYDKSSKKQTDFVEFQLKVLASGEDVDEDDLKAWMTKPDGTSRALADAAIRATYYLTEDAAWRLKKFLQDLGIEEEGSLRQMIEAAPGCQVNVFMKHRASEDGSTTFAEIGNTAPVGE